MIMMQKLWDYMMTRVKDDIGVKEYLSNVLVNFGFFAIVITLGLVVVSMVVR